MLHPKTIVKMKIKNIFITFFSIIIVNQFFKLKTRMNTKPNLPDFSMNIFILWQGICLELFHLKQSKCLTFFTRSYSFLAITIDFGFKKSGFLAKFGSRTSNEGKFAEILSI